MDYLKYYKPTKSLLNHTNSYDINLAKSKLCNLDCKSISKNIISRLKSYIVF